MEKSDFFERVYAVVEKVPHGKVTSYGAVAKFIGAPRSARMVGYAMNASVEMSNIPAHRVVNRNGLLTGKHHFPGSNLMQELLESEGVVVHNDQIQDFQNYFWDPSVELDREKFIA